MQNKAPFETKHIRLGQLGTEALDNGRRGEEEEEMDSLIVKIDEEEEHSENHNDGRRAETYRDNLEPPRAHNGHPSSSHSLPVNQDDDDQEEDDDLRELRKAEQALGI